ncbi:uncharacterized protein G2W53_002573 [Senna tora]|uniref:Uncharacterized protein n=1 Tax=Senna tora TaxID=362788 RepID=A0A834X905_9FABA|nr:uncharacterized protein G2W53_002573 [Senna tora]
MASSVFKDPHSIIQIMLARPLLVAKDSNLNLLSYSK